MASYAAAIEKELGVKPQLKKGKRGQFDVVVDGTTVATRKGGLIAKLMKKPWPEVNDVVAAVKACC